MCCYHTKVSLLVKEKCYLAEVAGDQTVWHAASQPRPTNSTAAPPYAVWQLSDSETAGEFVPLCHMWRSAFDRAPQLFIRQLWPTVINVAAENQPSESPSQQDPSRASAAHILINLLLIITNTLITIPGMLGMPESRLVSRSGKGCCGLTTLLAFCRMTFT